MNAATDVMDLAAFRAAYPGWLEGARERLEAKDYKGALAQGYPFPRHETAPWAPLGRPLAQSRVALVGTAGVYLPATQTTFDAEHPEGDHTHRLVPRDTPPEATAIAHTHFDHTDVDEDRNVAWPLQRLAELEREGIIGTLADTAYSVSGYCLRADRLVEETAPAIVAGLQAEGVDAALLVPV